MGNRSAQTENINGTAISYSYQYDNLNRLTQVQNGTAANQENYAYDPIGNRSTKTVNATTPSTIAYVYDAANQLKEIHQGSAAGTLLTAMVYDPNGSMTSKCEGTGVTTNGVTCAGTTTTSLIYDALNRLIQANKTGQANQTYAYDDSGRRIAKTVGGITTNFLYSGPDIVAEYANTWGLPVAQYTHGPNQDEPIERITQTGAQYFHHDGLGSIVGVTNNLGGTDATQRFDAWGNQIASTGTAPRYGFTGREPDAEIGLIFYRARYYDPSIGRFTQRDPIGLGGGLNQYAYVNGNPVNFTDPSGKCFEDACIGEIALARLGIAIAESTAVRAGVSWVGSRAALVAAKATAGFALGYEGAKVTGTQSELGRIGAGVAGAFGLGGSAKLVDLAAAPLARPLGTTAARAAGTVAVSGAIGSGAEFSAQAGDMASGVGPGHFEVGKIFGMGAVTAGASLLGGEAALGALGLEGLAGAGADILGATHTALGSYAGSKIFYPAENSSGSQSLTGFNPAPAPKH